MQPRTQFKPEPQKVDFVAQEQDVLQFWEDNKCFEKQLELTKDCKKYTFYDGPPFATGLPHYGHIAAGTIKDVVCRFASQTGHYVSRRFGWDCHGLPVEYEIDKALKITDKKQVLEMGIAKYNSECRKIVMTYSSEWERYVKRFGRWIDFKNDYKTLDLKFMQSVWWAFKQLFQKGLVYRGRKIMPYSNGCTTVLSNFQVQLNYKDTSDPSLYIGFILRKEPETKFLVWTTTPWTLPSNLALAVNPDFDYVKIKDAKGNFYIMAECRLDAFFGKAKDYQILAKMKGTELNELEYVPLFDFFINRAKDGCFRVKTASFVTSDAGTGIVHCAPGFGEEDYKMCVDKKIIHPDDPVMPLDESGFFTAEVPPYKGIYIKEADKIIIKDLKQKGLVVRNENFVHSYPYCWRSETPLIYKAVSTWFIAVTRLKQDLLKNNQQAQWVPKVIQQKKFENWLRDAKDWCFSRNRYWGNPIPLWISDDGEEVVCVGSLKQLEELTGHKATDLHREFIDHLTIDSKKGKGKLKRIDEVFDCWFESGAMPFAQVHYPFSTTEEEFSKIFPADFIGEGIDQTRGWFYTLNVIATGIRNSTPYKNLIVNGLVLTNEGKKMSKRLKNYTDPIKVCETYGADSIRLYLINSPLVRADNLNFSDAGVKAVVRDVFLPWYNSFRFLLQNISKYELSEGQLFRFEQNTQQLAGSFNVLDRWIISCSQQLIANVRKEMSEYKLYNVVPPLIKFLDNLTNWYLRLNRTRLKGEVSDADTITSLNVLFGVLLEVVSLMSSFVPFLTEAMYQELRKVIKPGPLLQNSVHHLLIPLPKLDLINEQIMERMSTVVTIIETARNLRQTKNVSLKQPILSLTVVNSSEELFASLNDFRSYIQQEINVNELRLEKDLRKYIQLKALPCLPVLGPKFKGNKKFGTIVNAIKALGSEQIEAFKQTGTITIEEHNLTQEDILVNEDFRNEFIQPHQAIGGTKVIVLLDMRQNEELKIRGYARQIITKAQKLKKKARVKPEDLFIISYKLGAKSEYLQKALNQERKSIDATIKKPLLPMESIYGLIELANDSSPANEEDLELKLYLAGPIVNFPQIKIDFGEKRADTIAKVLVTRPYAELRQPQSYNFSLAGEQILLVRGKHYDITI